jgi:protein-S-isoprenylcysteine O-methyltransferase Ste14
MIISALTLIFGETLIFASIELFTLFLLIFTVNHIYFVYSEEPGLTKRFGKEYITYKKNVPRWVPRLTPWEKDNNTE